MLGLALLPRTGDGGLVAAAESVAAKIAGTRPGRPAASLAASGWTAVPAAGADPALIRKAIRGERALRLTYAGAQGETTDRTVLPIALIYYVEAVVLVGWCELRQAFRHFRLDRIGAIALEGPSFRGRGGILRMEWQRQQQASDGAPS
jgi:predicted DNA-binding transcriptional regulator YafY